MHTDITFWIAFNVFVILMLALDLGLFNRKAHVIGIKEALIWSGVWISLALVFYGIIYFWQGNEKALEFLTGYLIEKSLSVDNIFVFALVFGFFKTPPLHQHKILFWGIIGALIMRAVFIFAGIALLENFHWTMYIFGGLLVFTGIKMLRKRNAKFEPGKNPVIRFFTRILPVTSNLHDGKFLARENGRLFATPLLLVLIVVETTDLIFAIDSIPAILAITHDTFIVYTSNVFAILGLRSLYFALAGILDRFRYLSVGLALILIFMGLKMIASDHYKLPVHWALIIILVILVSSILISLKPKRLRAEDPEKPDPPPGTEQL